MKTRLDKVTLVAAREIRQRTSSRGFRVATAITMLAALAYVLVPHLLATRNSVKVIALVKPYAASVPKSFEAAAAVEGFRITFRDFANTAAAKAALDAGTAYLAYDAKTGLVVKTLTSGSAATQFAERVAVELGNADALAEARLSPTQLAAISHPHLPAIVGLTHSPSSQPAEQKAATFESVLMYILLSQYGAWVMLGVVEEKSTRVIEVLLAALTPTELLIGKIVGIGTVAVIHAALVIVSLIVGLFAIGSSPTQVVSGSLLITAPIWFVVGYGFYCTLFGAVGSTVSRTEDAQAASFPVALPMLVGYLATLFTLGGSVPSAVSIALSMVPGVSPFLAPALYALHEISLGTMAISMALSIIATLLLAKLAVKIYTASILRIGARVRIGELRRSIASNP